MKPENSGLQCRFSKLTWMPCTAHVMDLFLDDVGKQDWANELFAWANSTIKFIRAHHKPLAIFHTKSRLELKQPGATSQLSMFTSC